VEQGDGLTFTGNSLAAIAIIGMAFRFPGGVRAWRTLMNSLINFPEKNANPLLG
jgi:hypothetical protein